MAFGPVRLSVTPLAIVNPWNASTLIGGPPVCETVCAPGRDCPQTAPPHAEPSYVTLPAQLRFTALAGLRPASCDAVRFDGVYPKLVTKHEAGIPGAARRHWKPSAAPDPVQFDPHDTSLRPGAATHLPLLHWLSRVQ
jgi:hypothetical protein